MFFRRSFLTPLVLLMTMGCSGQRNDADTPSPEVVEGELRLAGSDPMTMVMLRPMAGGEEVRLEGSLVEELRRLGGIVVSVTGKRDESAMRGFDVTSYEITSVQGTRPSVGTVVSRDGDLWLESESSVRLVDVPAGLRAQVGAKVWVIGTTVDGSLRPESYGVIREP